MTRNVNLESSSPVSKPTTYELSWYLFLFVIFSATLKYAQVIFLPIMIGLILYFCFCPLVDKLQKFRVSRWFSSISLVLTICFLVGSAVYSLSGPFESIFQTSGKNFSNLKKNLSMLKKPMLNISLAEKKINDFTDVTDQEVIKVKIKGDGAGESMLYRAWDWSLNFFTSLVIFFFLLLYGDALFCKVSAVLPYQKVKGSKDSLLHEIQNGTCFYLLTISAINLVLGLVIGSALYMQSFPNPFLWGAIAGMLNFIPYVGCIVGVGLIFLISLSNPGSGMDIVGPALTYFLINSVEGQLITPTIVGSALRLNPLVIVLSLIYWGWLWGVAGMFVAIPILIVLQIIGSSSTSLSQWTEALSL